MVAAGVFGAFRLARGQSDGLNYVESTPEGALRSFWAAAICLPAFLALQFLAWAGSGGPEAGLGRALVVQMLGYACAWTGFALASRPLAQAAGRDNRWPHFIAAWNWTNVVQYVVLLALTVPAALGLPGFLANALLLAALGYAVWLEWFVARTALQVSGGWAAAFVGLDLMLGLFIGGFVTQLSRA